MTDTNFKVQFFLSKNMVLCPLNLVYWIFESESYHFWIDSTTCNLMCQRRVHWKFLKFLKWSVYRNVKPFSVRKTFRVVTVYWATILLLTVPTRLFEIICTSSIWMKQLGKLSRQCQQSHFKVHLSWSVTGFWLSYVHYKVSLECGK